MDDPRWLKLITVGLILAALAVGYFLLSGRLISNSSVQKVSKTNEIVANASPSATPTASVLGQNVQVAPTFSPKPTPKSAYEKIVSRTQSNVQVLPKTGFPQIMAGIFSIGVMVVGLGLRRFPH